MIRFAVTVFLAAVLTVGATAAETGQLDASQTLFTIMAALNATGNGGELSSPSSHPLRAQIAAELNQRHLASLAPLREFFEKHRKATPAENLGQYVSYALSVNDPPNFAFRMRDLDTVPEAAALKGLSKPLSAFYKEANIAALWARSQPDIEKYLERYHSPVLEAVFQVNTYLRQPTSGFDGRHFQVFVELQAPPNQVLTRSYGNEYTIVVTPSAQVRTFEVRHAYLHYLLDPLATHAHDMLERKKSLALLAQKAPGLDASFKEDFLLLASESLIKAVESRLDRVRGGSEQAMRQGYILAPFFDEELAAYETQDQAIRIYYPDMLKGLEIGHEEARIGQVSFNEAAPAPKPAAVVAAPSALEQAEKLYESRDLPAAKRAFAALLDLPLPDVQRAAAYYGLARVAILQKDPETSQQLFLKSLSLQPEAPVKAWVLVYLARLSLASSEPGPAATYFQQALQVEGATAAARDAATNGIQGLSK